MIIRVERFVTSPLPHRPGRAAVGIEIRCAHQQVELRFPPKATFPEAPLRSRTVGFPESGSDLGSLVVYQCRPSPTTQNEKCWLTLRPDTEKLYCTFAKMRIPQFIQYRIWLRIHQIDHRVPRAPLPDMGVTLAGMTS